MYSQIDKQRPSKMAPKPPADIPEVETGIPEVETGIPEVNPEEKADKLNNPNMDSIVEELEKRFPSQSTIL